MNYFDYCTLSDLRGATLYIAGTPVAAANGIKTIAPAVPFEVAL